MSKGISKPDVLTPGESARRQKHFNVINSLRFPLNCSRAEEVWN